MSKSRYKIIIFILSVVALLLGYYLYDAKRELDNVQRYDLEVVHVYIAGLGNTASGILKSWDTNPETVMSDARLLDKQFYATIDVLKTRSPMNRFGWSHATLITHYHATVEDVLKDIMAGHHADEYKEMIEMIERDMTYISTALDSEEWLRMDSRRFDQQWWDLIEGVENKELLDNAYYQRGD